MGTPGHMNHPFDIGSVNTGEDLINFFLDAAELLQKKPASIKWDGINVSFKLVTDENGKRSFRMDRGTSAPESVIGMTSQDAYSKWPEGHGMPVAIEKLLTIFNTALPKIEPELKALGMWDDSTKFFNTEYMEEGGTNVVKYDRNMLAIHGINQFYEKKAQPHRIRQGTGMDRSGLERPIDPNTNKLIKNVSIETNYNREALNVLISKVQPIAAKFDFSILGDTPTENVSPIDFETVLDTNFPIYLTRNDIEKHSIRDWLQDTINPRDKKIVTKQGRTTGALSKEIYVAVLNKKPLVDWLESQEDVQAAINGAIFYHATKELGNAVKRSLKIKGWEGPLADVYIHEGIVLRDPKFGEKPVKITGEFILEGMGSSFGSEERQELVQQTGADVQIEKPKLALLAGGFKPPHKGHVEMVKHYLKLVGTAGKIIILLGSGGLEPRTINNRRITAQDSMEMWDIYLRDDPSIPWPSNRIEFQNVEGAGPIAPIIDYIRDQAPEDQIILLGAGEKDEDRWPKIMANPKNNPRGLDIETTPAPNIVDDNGKPLSARNMRDAIEGGDFETFKSYIPNSSLDSAEKIFITLGGGTIEEPQEELQEDRPLPLGIFLRLIEEELTKSINEQYVGMPPEPGTEDLPKKSTPINWHKLYSKLGKLIPDFMQPSNKRLVLQDAPEFKVDPLETQDALQSMQSKALYPELWKSSNLKSIVKNRRDKLLSSYKNPGGAHARSWLKYLEYDGNLGPRGAEEKYYNEILPSIVATIETTPINIGTKRDIHPKARNWAGMYEPGLEYPSGRKWSATDRYNRVRGMISPAQSIVVNPGSRNQLTQTIDHELAHAIANQLEKGPYRKSNIKPMDIDPVHIQKEKLQKLLDLDRLKRYTSRWKDESDQKHMYSWATRPGEIYAEVIALRNALGRPMTAVDVIDMCMNTASSTLRGTHIEAYINCKDSPTKTAETFNSIAKVEPRQQPTTMVAENTLSSDIFLELIEEELYKEEKKRNYSKRLKYGYSLSELGGEPIDEKSGTDFRYGASMNKPILAFINLVLAREGVDHHRTGKKIRRLTSDELDQLISYRDKSQWSNRINRALSDLKYRKHKGWKPKYKTYYNTKRDEFGISQKQASKVLERFNLHSLLPGVHAAWSGKRNSQSPRGYNKFMSLLTNISNNPSSKYFEDATEILKYVRKRQGGYPGYGLQKYLNKEFEKAGWGKDFIKSVYGKGGRAGSSLNYSVILNDKYVLSLYTKKQGDIDPYNWKKNMHKITLDVLKKNLKPENLDATYIEIPPEDIHLDSKDIDIPPEPPVTIPKTKPPEAAPTSKEYEYLPSDFFKDIENIKVNEDVDISNRHKAGLDGPQIKVTLGRGKMNKQAEKDALEDNDDQIIDEVSSMAGGSVEGAMTQSPFTELDVEKENEDETKRSHTLEENDELVEEVMNYLLNKMEYSNAN